MRSMRFTKMHGLGNDYVYVNGFAETLGDPSAMAVKVSDRHFGIGGDGLVMILPSEVADVRMQMFNADGSEGRMCGNAIRCVAKFAHERGIATDNPVRIETASGVKTIQKVIEGDAVTAATVDMGEPILTPSRRAGGDSRRRERPDRRSFDGRARRPAGAGRSHVQSRWAIRTQSSTADAVDAVELTRIGPILERAAVFPDRINVQLRAGDLAGRGPDADLGAGQRNHAGLRHGGVGGLRCRRAHGPVRARRARPHCPAATLRIEWRESDNHVFMTGPASEVFEGEWVG